VTAPPIRAAYSLVDHDGNPVTEGTYRGRWQLVQFGFTACKVVCPRALTKLGQALDALERAVGPVPLAPLYVTVDPDRDSPAVLKAFLAAAYPRFTGLTGTAQQVDDAKKAFRVFTRRRDTPEGYDVQHTALTYLLDRDGRPAAYWPDTHDADAVTRDLVRLVGPA
jgi:cytochrome oxidase Cu insertion factor (SCO1/SenC/PrrC family)